MTTRMLVRMDESIVREVRSLYPGQRFGDILKMALRTYKVVTQKQRDGYRLLLERGDEKITVTITPGSSPFPSCMGKSHLAFFRPNMER